MDREYYLNSRNIFSTKVKMKNKISKRPWGVEEIFPTEGLAKVKLLVIKPHKRFSLQRHKHRKEFWKFLDNPAKVTVGKKTFKVKKDDEVLIPYKTAHRIEAYSNKVTVLEISFGKFDEHDEIRLEDDYGRK